MSDLSDDKTYIKELEARLDHASGKMDNLQAQVERLTDYEVKLKHSIQFLITLVIQRGPIEEWDDYRQKGDGCVTSYAKAEGGEGE
jgi:hypothetical protein